MTRDGFSLARSVELAAQWEGLFVLLLLRIFSWLGVVGGLGECRRVVGDLHCRLSDFIHRVVVHRRVEAIRGWRNWLREDPLVHPYTNGSF